MPCLTACAYGTCGSHPYPGCGGCCGCMGGCFVEYEEEQGRLELELNPVFHQLAIEAGFVQHVIPGTSLLEF